jgi:hypothetical protein
VEDLSVLFPFEVIAKLSSATMEMPADPAGRERLTDLASM